MDERFTIQEAALRSGVSVHTLRYYERIGLLEAVDRSDSGHRAYTPQDLGRLRFLTMLRRTGMSIQQMLAFAELERHGNATFGARYELLEQHRVQLMARMAELQQHLTYLDEKVRYFWALEQRQQLETPPRTGT